MSGGSGQPSGFGVAWQALVVVDLIHQRNVDLLQRGCKAIVGLLDAIDAAKKPGASDAQLEVARALGEATDYAWQGQMAALRWQEQGK